MSGTTAHGIRHPDGSTKARDLGPELERMADDLDGLIFEGLGPIAEAIVRQLIAEALANGQTVQDAVANAVNGYLAGLNIAPQKSVHIENGKVIYDGPGGVLATHYLLPDENGQNVARPTAWPVPTAAPALNW